jgi:hypothetical protein
VAITERDSKGKAAPKTHRFGVEVRSTCSNVSHAWPLLARFRGAGRFVVTLQAKDAAGSLGKPVTSALVFH